MPGAVKEIGTANLLSCHLNHQGQIDDGRKIVADMPVDYSDFDHGKIFIS